MIPYYALIGIPLLFAIVYELLCERNCIGASNKKNYTIVVFFSLYFILLAFRDETIGVDTSRYIHLFEKISTYNWNEFFHYYSGSDIGYYILNKVLSDFVNNAQWLLIVTATIIIVPIAVLYYKETKNALVSIALYMALPIFIMSFSGIRQSIAMAFVAPAVYFVKEKKIIKFSLVVIIACLFHNSAFIMLLMYPLYHCTIKAKHLLVIIPVGLILLKFNTRIYLFLITIMNNEVYEERYAYTSETGAYTMLIVFALFTLYAFVFVDENSLDEETKGYRNFLVIVLFLQMFAPVNTIAMRMNYYFIIFIPIIITRCTYLLKTDVKNIKLLVCIIIYILFTAYYLNKAQSIDSLGIYPYSFF